MYSCARRLHRPSRRPGQGAAWQSVLRHRVLKSGCKILEHQHRDAATLLCAITLDAVIAWRRWYIELFNPPTTKP